MTTAPQENRGGLRPKAKQNNPANVKGTGGNGQSGRYTGFAYGENKALAQQQAAASIKQPSFNAGSFRMADARSMQQVTPITAATENPDQTIFDGAPVGGGMNSIPGLPQQTESDNTEFNASIRAYAPVLTYINSRPETSKETRQVISLLMRGIQ
jgi:hypothetical protein